MYDIPQSESYYWENTDKSHNGISLNKGEITIVKKPPEPIGGLIHEPTMITIHVYKKMNWFHKLMIKWCFGLKYIDYDKNK